MVCVLNVRSEDTQHKREKKQVDSSLIPHVPSAPLDIRNLALDARQAHARALPVQLVTNPKKENLVKLVGKDTTETSLVYKTAKCVLMDNIRILRASRLVKIALQGGHTKVHLRVTTNTTIVCTTVKIALGESIPLVLGQPRARPAPEDIIPQVVLPAVQYVHKGTLQLQAL